MYPMWLFFDGNAFDVIINLSAKQYGFPEISAIRV